MANWSTLDLTVDSKQVRTFQRCARWFCVGLLCGVAVMAMLAICIPVERRGNVRWMEAVIAVVSPYTVLALYLSDARKGNGAAVRGMLVVAPAFALWFAWGSARVNGEFIPWLGVFTGIVMLLPGLVCGAMVGVVLGWIQRTALGAFTKAQWPGGGSWEGLSDPWLDHHPQRAGTTPSTSS